MYFQISNFSGDAEDYLSTFHHQGMQFSTRDQDNDLYADSCAVEHTGWCCLLVLHRVVMSTSTTQGGAVC